MNITATNPSTGLTVTSTPAAAGPTAPAMTADSFLKLLVTQMRNQDPLSPMDNAQVTSQMAQINTVTGIGQLNTTMQGLASQFMQMQAMQGASLVGHTVVVPGNMLNVDPTTGTGRGGFELTNAADAVKVEILAPSGAVLKTLQLGAETAGMHSFAWPAGAAAAAGGLSFRVSATSGGATLASTALMTDTVAAVNTAGNTFSLELQNSGTVPYSSVKAFN
jgi:flagellar basal-body rod modification protein FlgD